MRLAQMINQYNTLHNTIGAELLKIFSGKLPGDEYSIITIDGIGEVRINRGVSNTNGYQSYSFYTIGGDIYFEGDFATEDGKIISMNLELGMDVKVN